MEFGIEKWAMLVIKCGKRHLTEWNYQTKIRLKRFEENETHKY